MAANVFNTLHFDDNVKLQFGEHTNGEADFTIFHNAPSSVSTSNIISAIRNAGGAGPTPKPIKILANEINFIGQNDNLADFVETSSGNSLVKLYANSSVKFETTSVGVTVTGSATISTINNPNSDTDKFLVSNGGLVGFRTGAEVRSDIGAGTGNGTVTSVGLTMPSAFTVSSSPVTTSGTIAVTGAGTTSQYIRGDGSLATFSPGTMSSWIIETDSGAGSSQTISDGNTIDLIGGTGITTSNSGYNLTIDVDNTVVVTSGAQTINGTKTFGTVPDVGTRGLSDNTTFAASTAWVQGQNYGTVSSVAITETGSALTITNSPITTSGTINIAGAGTSSQVILGDLSLATLTVGTVTSVSGGTGISVSGSASVTPTVNIDYAGADNAILVATSEAPVGTDTIWFSDATDTTIKKATINQLPFAAGTVTGVTAGDGLTGGTINTSGTISVDYTATGLIADCPGGTGSPDENDLIMIGLDSSSSGETRAYEIQEITSLAPQGTVTSVGITAGTGISVSNSPITSSGNITVTALNNGTVTSVSAANPTTGATANNPLTISGSTTVNPTVNFNRLAVEDLPNLITTETSTGVGGGVTTGTWNANTQIDKTDNIDHSYQGEIVYFGTATGSLTQGKLYVFTTTDGIWDATLATSAGKSAGLLAIALGTTVSAGMLTRGMYTLSYTSTGSTTGSPLYLSSSSAGTVTHEPPSGTGAFVRIIGTQIDSTNGQIFFHPDNTFIELS